jgi:hypothetical protein
MGQEVKSFAPVAEVAASSCFHRAAALAVGKILLMETGTNLLTKLFYEINRFQLDILGRHKMNHYICIN